MKWFWLALSAGWIAAGIGYVDDTGGTIAAHAACSLACLILGRLEDGPW